MKRFLFLMLAALLLLTLPVTACAEEGYTYSVRVFAGNMGTINGGEEFVQSGIPYGTEWSFDVAAIEVTNPKYYVRGIRESGLDNDTVSGAAFRVRKDMDFVVAYGVRGNEVAYTVSFVRDSDGEQLSPPATYYGNVGDKPVVACRFIDGYYPSHYNITGTLSENAAANQFVFRYAPIPASRVGATTVVPGNQPGVQQPGPQQGNAANQAGGNAQNENAGQAADTEQGQTENGFPEQTEDILDLDVPLAENGDQTGQQGGAISAAAIAGIAVGTAALLGLLWYFFLFRKKKDSRDKKA